MDVLTEVCDLRKLVSNWRRAGQRVALVPTMGCLHSGHMTLVETARREAGRVVVSIFVNRGQFGPTEDFSRYPRTLNEDCQLLAAAGVDAVFAPNDATVYPNGVDEHCRISVPGLESILCGAFRPGHFAGVATVVAKLFNMALPDVAYFGRKDYQQLLVIRKMVTDCNFGVEVVAVNTFREEDGLALSSRNGYLSVAERATAPVVYRSLCAAAEMVRASPLETEQLGIIEGAGMGTLMSQGFRPDYFAVRRAIDLETPEPEEQDIVILTAAWLGSTRLIDNVAVHKPR